MSQPPRGVRRAPHVAVRGLLVDVEEFTEAATVSVRVRGEIDVATVPALRARISTLIAQGVREIDLDLNDVPFCDVPGLNLLLRAQAELDSRGGGLTVRGPCPPLRLMLAKLDLRLNLVPAAGAENAGMDGAFHS